MLRITQRISPGAAKRYYATDDLGRPAEHLYGGKLAEELGLVSYSAFCESIDGRHPATGEKLTQRMHKNRIVMWDYTFLAPKSVSIMAEVAGDARLHGAFLSAVRDAMGEVESHAITRSLGPLGMREKVTGEIAYMLNPHRTARPDFKGISDPHKHAHACVLNVTRDGDSRKAMKMRQAYYDNGYYAAVFHASLSWRVKALGYDVRKKGKYWEIDGVSDKLIKQFSKRGRELEALAEEKGVTGRRKKGQLAERHRSPKPSGPGFDKMQDRWRAEVSPQELKELDDLKAGAKERRMKSDHYRTASTVMEAFQLATVKQTKQRADYRRIAAAAMQKLPGETTPRAVEFAIARCLRHDKKTG